MCTTLASPGAPRTPAPAPAPTRPSARALAYLPAVPAPVPLRAQRPCAGAARPAPSPASAQMGSSPFQVSAPIFFFLVSSYWKIPKILFIHIFIFIFHNTQINFYKKNFSSFCSVLHCKTLEKSFSSFSFPVLYTVHSKYFSNIFPNSSMC